MSTWPQNCLIWLTFYHSKKGSHGSHVNCTWEPAMVGSGFDHIWTVHKSFLCFFCISTNFNRKRIRCLCFGCWRGHLELVPGQVPGVFLLCPSLGKPFTCEQESHQMLFSLSFSHRTHTHAGNSSPVKATRKHELAGDYWSSWTLAGQSKFSFAMMCELFRGQMRGGIKAQPPELSKWDATHYYILYYIL